jgi:putative PEP-CTERM system histidine kinase
VDSTDAALTVASYGMASAAYAAFAFYLFSQDRPHRQGAEFRPRAIFAAALFSLIWSGLGLAYGLWDDDRLVPAQAAADILRYGAWYAFILALLLPAKGLIDRRFLRSLAVGLGVLVSAGVVLQTLVAAGLDEDWVQRGALLHALLMIVVALFLLEQLYRNTAADSRWNIKPLCLGLGAAFLFDFYIYSEALLFGRLDADAVAIRGFVHALVIPLLAISSARSRYWIARLHLSQKVLVHTTTLMAAGGYLLFMAAVGYYVRYFGGDWGRALQLAAVFAALLMLGVLAVSGSMRAKLRVLVGKHFFRYRYDYREEWLKFTRTLAAQNSPQSMGQQVIRGLADMVESPAGCLWLKDTGRQAFAQFARWNMAEIGAEEGQDSSLCRFLQGSGWVVNLEEFRSTPRRYERLKLPEWLSLLGNAWLVVPLVSAGELTGFVVLARSRTQIEVNWEVNDLLRTAGSQAAGFLAQMLATEALLEARKFDSFNRMSAFVVHDLKNIVAQLALMLKNAERHRDNPEFQADMLMTVDHAVERMRQLMLQLREGARPPGVRSGVALVPIFEAIAAAKGKAGRRVEVQVADAVVVRGDGERLERVFGHLVQNALDATAADGRVWVKLQRQAGWALVEVGDTGHGMSADFIRERLFKPFQTTKQAGMGIGAYESFQYVRELGGDVAVDSEVGQGTRITVKLPPFEVDSRSALIEREAA